MASRPRLCRCPRSYATSLYLALAFHFGADHPNVAGALEWLMANQLDDGGWNCRTVRFGDRHSSFHTSISALGVLQQRCRNDGTWPVQNRHPGRVWFDMVRTGKPSRWNTAACPAQKPCRLRPARRFQSERDAA